MTSERFNQLLNGPLHHPMYPFQLSRLARALAFVVEQTGEAGEVALELFCVDQDKLDRLKGGEDDAD